MSAWDKLLERVPMRMRASLRDGDSGVVIRALCTIIDDQEKVLCALRARVDKADEALLVAEQLAYEQRMGEDL